MQDTSSNVDVPRTGGGGMDTGERDTPMTEEDIGKYIPIPSMKSGTQRPRGTDVVGCFV